MNPFGYVRHGLGQYPLEPANSGGSELAGEVTLSLGELPQFA